MAPGVSHQAKVIERIAMKLWALRTRRDTPSRSWSRLTNFLWLHAIIDRHMLVFELTEIGAGILITAGQQLLRAVTPGPAMSCS